MDDIIGVARSALQPFLQVSNLTDLYAAYKTIPVQYALIGHCLFVAATAPDLKHRFLVHFWITYLAGFGGGIISSLLMMDPVKAPINILANNTIGVTFFVCWWLIAYSPFDIVNRLHSLPPVKLVTKACVTFMRANLIINRVDLAVGMYPGVIAAPLILGTLAGSGGKMITDVIRTGWGAPPAAAEASVPTFVWRSAALAAAGYWGASKYTSLLTSQEAAALIITVLVLHSILSDILGPTITDFTYPIAKVAHTLSLVPMPSTATAPSGAKGAKKAVEQQAKQAKQQQAVKPVAPAAAKQQPQQQTAAESKTAAPEPAKASSGKSTAVATVKADSSSKGLVQPASKQQPNGKQQQQPNGKKTESKKSR